MPIRYKPLNADNNEIRLLRKLPSRDHLLHFNLETFPLSKAPPFWAFSYVWGDPQKTSRIVVNGHNFEATENLVSALHTHVNDILTIRSKINHPHFRADYLWADAICINQSDPKERSQQVQRMRFIYQKGTVCIYLNTTNREAYRSVWEMMLMICDNLEKGLHSKISKRVWADMVQFFSKPWFQRMWLIQEFVMADSKPLLLYLGGHKTFSDIQLRDSAWEVFQTCPSHLATQDRSALLNGIKQYMSLAEIKDRIKDGRPCSFFTLLWIFRDRLATDPKDKIYSLLGLLQQSDVDRNDNTSAVALANRGLAIGELIINYDAKVEDVYASLVKAMVIDIAPEHLEESSFRASGTRGPNVVFSEPLYSINVSGICSGSVSILGTRPPDQFNSFWVSEWFHGLHINYRLQVGSIYGVSPNDAEEEFLLAVCAMDAKDKFNNADALADDYILFYPGASKDWGEMLRRYHEEFSEVIDQSYYLIDIRIARMVDGRKIFIGENGHCGLVPDHTEPGDLICVLFGCDVPVVLRRVSDHYIFIGECYARGLMYGEAIEALERGDFHAQQFEIF